MTFHRKIEVSKPIFGQRVSSTLNHHGIRSVESHASIHNFLEKLKISGIIDTLLERHINRIVFADPLSNRIECSSSRKEIFIKLMKAHSHDSISMIESFLNSITMMNINIEVQHSRVNFQHLENAYHNIIDIAKSTCLCFFGMVITARPVDSYIRYTSKDNVSSVNASSSSKLTKMIEPLKPRTVKRLIDFEESSKFIIIPNFAIIVIFKSTNNLILLTSNPFLQIVNISRMMKQIKFLLIGFLRLEHGQIITKLIILYERMRHLDSLRFHRMLLTQDKISY